MQIAFYLNGQVHAAMLAYLFQHVVEEAQAGSNVALSATIQIYFYQDVGLFRGATDGGTTFAGKQKFGHFVPIACCQSANGFQLVAQQRIVILQEDGAATQVLGKLHIGGAVANNETSSQIVGRIVDILGQHTGAWLACGGILFGETTVNANVVEGYPLAFQRFHHQVMCRPKGLFGERGGAQTILVGNHYKLEVELATHKA